MSTDTAPDRGRPSVGTTLLVLTGTVVFMTVFLGIYAALGISVPYMGVLFLLYWAAMLHMDFAVYPASAIGAVIGIALAWMLVASSAVMGPAGTAAGYAALAAILFCYTRKQAKVVANNATLLFVLVAAIPELQIARTVVPMLESVVLGAAFMGIVAWLIGIARSRRRSAA